MRPTKEMSKRQIQRSNEKTMKTHLAELLIASLVHGTQYVPDSFEQVTPEAREALERYLLGAPADMLAQA